MCFCEESERQLWKHERSDAIVLCFSAGAYDLQLLVVVYNPNSREVGTFCKNVIKSRICDLFILFNFHLIDKSTSFH